MFVGWKFDTYHSAVAASLLVSCGGFLGEGEAPLAPVAPSVFVRGPSGLPAAPDHGRVPKPSGAASNLTILDWAGFAAAVTFTFDDSQPSQIEHYAELAAVGVPMTFYVSSATRAEAGYDATWTRAVQDGHEIGNHTEHHCHADLTGCSFGPGDADLLSEFDACSTYVTAHYGQKGVWTGASPFGDRGYDDAAAEGFFVFRGVRCGQIRGNDATDPFDLPCHVATTGETESMFDAVVDAARAAHAWQIILIHTIQPTSAVWYNPVTIADLIGSMAHAKAQGDVWVDTLANVGAYWRGQKTLSSVTPATSGGTTTWTWTLPPHFPPGKYLRVTTMGGTLTQAGHPLEWNERGYFEVALDAGSLALTP